MFPKIVHSKAKSEKSNLMGMVLLGTVVLGSVRGDGVVGAGAVGGANSFSGRTMCRPPGAAAVVCLGDGAAGAGQRAAEQSAGALDFEVVPALIVLAVVYAFALTRFHETPVMVLQTLGVFNVLLLAVCAWFTWGAKSRSKR